jgi:hypothetical protein
MKHFHSQMEHLFSCVDKKKEDKVFRDITQGAYSVPTLYDYETDTFHYGGGRLFDTAIGPL